MEFIYCQFARESRRAVREMMRIEALEKVEMEEGKGHYLSDGVPSTPDSSGASSAMQFVIVFGGLAACY
jgi:hypothetical protein